MFFFYACCDLREELLGSILWRSKFTWSIKNASSKLFCIILQGPDQPWPDKQWGLCIWDDVIEHTGPVSYLVNIIKDIF